MKRLGKFSGKIYTEKEVLKMAECGIIVTEEQAVDEQWIKQHHLRDLLDCVKCGGCPLAAGTIPLIK